LGKKKEIFQVINAFEFDLATPDDHEHKRRPSPTRGHAMPR